MLCPYFFHMSIKELFNKLTSGIQEYIQTEKELLKLRVIKELAGVLGMVFGAVFIIMLFHVAIALLGLWVSFYLSSILGSYTLGFGITGLLYLVWFTVSLIFRKTLLIKPFTSMVVAAMTDEEKIENKEDEQQTT